MTAYGKNLLDSSRKKQLKRNISISTSLGCPDESHENLNLPVIGVSSRFLSPTPTNQLQDSENQLKGGLLKEHAADNLVPSRNPIKRRVKSLPLLQNKHNILGLQLNVSPTGLEKNKNLKANETLLVDSLITVKPLK